MSDYPSRRISQAPNSWLFEGRPNRGAELKGVMLHATRSGVSDGDDGPRTERWMFNQNNGSAAQGWGGSCDEIIFESGERVLVPADYRRQSPTYGAGFGDAGTWCAGWYYYQIELAQGRPEDPYLGAIINSAAERVAELVRAHGFRPERIPYLSQTGAPPQGICTHEDSANGDKLGKSDPGANFPWPLFLERVAHYLAPAPPAESEDDMPPKLFKSTAANRPAVFRRGANGELVHVTAAEWESEGYGPAGVAVKTYPPGHGIWSSAPAVFPAGVPSEVIS